MDYLPGKYGEFRIKQIDVWPRQNERFIRNAFTHYRCDVVDTPLQIETVLKGELTSGSFICLFNKLEESGIAIFGHHKHLWVFPEHINFTIPHIVFFAIGDLL